MNVLYENQHDQFQYFDQDKWKAIQIPTQKSFQNACFIHSISLDNILTG